MGEGIEHEIWKPRAYVLTERRVPEPIFVAAFLGTDRLLRIEFAVGSSRESYVRQALEAIPPMLDRRQEIPAFGRPVGFVVNYMPRRAIRFDLEGRALELLPRAYWPGSADLRESERRVAPEPRTVMWSTFAHDTLSILDIPN